MQKKEAIQLICKLIKEINNDNPRKKRGNIYFLIKMAY